MIVITLKGRPITKKNHQRIVGGARKFIIQSKVYLDFQDSCLWQIKEQYQGEMIKDKVHLRVYYYMPDRRSRPDLVNLLQATCDILEKARVIENDRNIISFDGSRIKEIDKLNPRTEIYLKMDIKVYPVENIFDKSKIGESFD